VSRAWTDASGPALIQGYYSVSIFLRSNYVSSKVSSCVSPENRLLYGPVQGISGEVYVHWAFSGMDRCTPLLIPQTTISLKA
jgi:hypothetical protein